MQSPAASTSGLLATLLSIGTLVFGILSVFNLLQDALNVIWRAAAARSELVAVRAPPPNFPP